MNKRFLILGALIVVCAASALVWFLLYPTKKIPDQLQLTKAEFSDLEGWEKDDFLAFLPALKISCAKVATLPDSRSMGGRGIAGTAQDWKGICEQVQSFAGSSNDFRTLIEASFTPFSVTNGEDYEGLFTGYYEASLNGSLTRSEKFSTPLLKRPDDLVMVDLGAFRDSLKGQRVAGYVKNGRLRPYFDRTKIEKGALDDQALEIVWVDSAVDAFFLHIQGSGRVALAEGGDVRVGYAGQNGHPYFAIGKALIEQNHVAREDMSMQAIRDWLEHNPADADTLMRLNKSYIFFRELNTSGPIGAQGVVLTAKRSLAVDRKWMPLGVPIWLDTEVGEGPNSDKLAPFQRLLMAQDTGGAIRGPVRGDVFWGHGPGAYNKAGAMKSRGRYWMLLPNAVAQKHAAIH